MDSHLVGDLELLALADVAGLGDGGLEAGEGLAVELLREKLAMHSTQATTSRKSSSPKHYGDGIFAAFHASLVLLPRFETYLSAGNDNLDFAPRSGDQLAELGADGSQQGEAVVLGKGVHEVLDDLASGTGALLKLGHDGALVGGGETRGGQDGSQLGVIIEEASERSNGLGGRLERGGLHGRGILNGAGKSQCFGPRCR